MYEPAAERKAIWDAFLARWPLETLAEMPLEQYSESGNTDCFTYWLEVKTESLGSIWGGSAIKFGVYGRKDRSPKRNDGGACYTENHGWLQKYGASPEKAFAAVRMEIVRVAKAARAADLAELRQQISVQRSGGKLLSFTRIARTPACSPSTSWRTCKRRLTRKAETQSIYSKN